MSESPTDSAPFANARNVGFSPGTVFAVVPHLLDQDRSWATFLVACPYPLPIPELPASGIVASRQGEPLVKIASCSLSGKHDPFVPKTLLRFGSGLSGFDSKFDKAIKKVNRRAARTRAERWALLLGTENVFRGEARSQAHTATALLERCLAAYNDWLHYYRVGVEAMQPYPLTLENLAETVLVSTHRPGSPPAWNGFIIPPGATSPRFHSNIDPSLWSQRIARLRLMDDHPIDVAISWRLSGERLTYYDGQHSLAIVCLQTSAECLLTAAWRCMVLDEEVGMCVGPADSQDMERPSFRTRLDFVASALSDDALDARDPAHPVARYRSELYRVRNQVAHEGRHVDVPEVERALNALDDLRSWLIERLLKSRHRFPRTALLFHGTVGLKANGCFDEEMSRFVNELNEAGRATDFWK